MWDCHAALAMTIKRRLAMTFCRCEGRPLLSLRGTSVPKQSDAPPGLPRCPFTAFRALAHRDDTTPCFEVSIIYLN